MREEPNGLIYKTHAVSRKAVKLARMVGDGCPLRREGSTWLSTTSLCWVTSATGKMIDGLTEGEVRSETGGIGLFRQLAGGFGTLHAQLSGAEKHSLHPSWVQNDLRWTAEKLRIKACL
jgi:hypothetical protein